MTDSGALDARGGDRPGAVPDRAGEIPPLDRRAPLRDRLAGASAERRFVALFLVWLAAFAAIYLAVVATELGQRIENLALSGAALRTEVERQAGLDRLAQISVLAFALTLGVLLAISLLRGRFGAGVAVAVLMGGSVLTAEALKRVLLRPELVDGPGWLLRNSYPSGTAAVAAAMAVGAILVSPDRLRWIVVPVGAIYAAIVADATQTTGWHRLSDTIGGVLVVLAVGSAGLAVLARARLVQRTSHGRIDRRVRTFVLLAAAAAAALAIVILALALAFPLLMSPTGARGVFLQTAFPLLGVAAVAAAIVAFGWAVEPFTIGRRRPSEPAPAEPSLTGPAPSEPGPIGRG
jgi:MFS family permease